MTGIQELQYAILGLEAELAGKRLELAMVQGERDTARVQMRAKIAATIKRRDFRIQCAEDAGGCFFDSAGAVDAKYLAAAGKSA